MQGAYRGKRKASIVRTVRLDKIINECKMRH
ncbi:hypothetical protein SAMN05216383_105136 [Prevotella sp. KH2C16]|nr:hypothetical protein SAMN05216383_105136 [Prevotella sp. KH2C16]